MPHDPPPGHRLILLGASNLTVGLPFILRTVHTGLNAPLDVFAALGHGRSYGMWSRVLHRELPGITECGLWKALRKTATSLPSPPGRGAGGEGPWALLTDVGNDLLYGAAPVQIAGWVETCLQRLTEQQARIVLTTLPMTSIERLSAWRYHLTRLIFFPGRGTSWPEMKRRALALNNRLLELAQKYGAQVVEPPGEWYGFDPIHIRHTRRKEAWRCILSHWPEFDSPVDLIPISAAQRLRLWTHQPELRRGFGREHTTPQPLHWFDDLTVALF